MTDTPRPMPSAGSSPEIAPADGNRWQSLAATIALPLIVGVVLVVAWDRAVVLSQSRVLPTPLQVVQGLSELANTGMLWRYIMASLLRVCWSFLMAVLIGVPLGLLIGWYPSAYKAINPLIQGLRPISPIAWIPLAILWFGLSDAAPMFLIFWASVFPITVAATAAVHNIPSVYLKTASNFHLSGFQLFRHVILPATLPQILTGLRIALGIAWLVVVAAEMIVVNPEVGGLGYLIIDARNAGSRYDLVVAGMVCIGVIGMILDLAVKQLERHEALRWGYSRP